MAKNFSDSPALMFLTGSKAEKVRNDGGVYDDTPTHQHTDTHTHTHNGQKESRSKRFQILLTPSIHERMAARAEQEGISMNELIYRAINKYLEEGR